MFMVDFDLTFGWNICQCSLAAGRFTSGLKSITVIVSAGAFIHAIIFLWLLLIYRLAVFTRCVQHLCIVKNVIVIY